MKKELIAFAFALLFIPLAYSIQINAGPELNRGEIFIAGLIGEFYKPITEENVYFYRNAYTATPFDFELLEIGRDYYISAYTLGKTPGNYSLVIKNSEYSIAGGGKSSEDIKINFTIIGSLAEFSATPGVQVLEYSNKPFFLQVQNLKDNEIIVSVDTNPSEEPGKGGFFESLFSSTNEGQAESQFVFRANEKKQIELKFNNLTETGLREVRLSSGNFTQKVFVYVLSAEKKPEAEKLAFEQEFFNISMATNSNAERILYLKNSGEKDFANVTIFISDSLKGYVSAVPDFFEFFEANETKKIILNISSKSEPEKISGEIKAESSDNAFVYADISVEIIEGFVSESQEENKTELPKISKSCAEINGSICGKSQKCLGEQVVAKDGICCFEKCTEKKKSSAGKIIGWGIIIILMILYIWFYLSRYKKAKAKANLLEIAKGGK